MLPGDKTPLLEWAIIWITGLPDRGSVGGDTGAWLVGGGDVVADLED